MKYFPLWSVILASMMSGAASSAANPSNVIIDHSSGYVVFSYEKATVEHDENHYAQLVRWLIGAEIKDARTECKILLSILGRSPFNSLNKNIIDVFDSVKIEKKFDDYALISSLIRKHAGSRSNKNIKNFGSIPYIDITQGGIIWREKERRAAGRPSNLTSNRQLIRNIFPVAFMNTTKKTYLKYTNNISASISELKTCYIKVEELSNKHVNNSLGINTFKVGTVKVLEIFESSMTAK